MVVGDLEPTGDKYRPHNFGKAALGVWERREGRWQRRQLMFVDMKKAHLDERLKEGEGAFISFPDG